MQPIPYNQTVAHPTRSQRLAALGQTLLQRLETPLFVTDADGAPVSTVIHCVGRPNAVIARTCAPSADQCRVVGQSRVVGGSVRKGKESFFAEVRRGVQAALGGYVVSTAIGAEIDEYIVAPALEDDAGVCGAMALGLQAITKSR